MLLCVCIYANIRYSYNCMCACVSCITVLYFKRGHHHQYQTPQHTNIKTRTMYRCCDYISEGQGPAVVSVRALSDTCFSNDFVRLLCQWRHCPTIVSVTTLSDYYVSESIVRLLCQWNSYLILILMCLCICLISDFSVLESSFLPNLKLYWLDYDR